MSEEEIEILKELSEQSDFGDLPFLYYGDLIGKLLANYNKEKEKNKPQPDCEISTEKISNDKIDEITILKQIKNKLEENNIPIETFIAEWERQQKEIEEIKEEYKNEQLAELKELNNYIRKDKIREKLLNPIQKEIKELYKEFNKDEEVYAKKFVGTTSTIQELQAIEGIVLEELLEE